MTNLENLKTLIAIKAQADPLTAQIQELGNQWTPVAGELGKVLDQSKTTVFILEDGSVKLVSFRPVMTPVGQQLQLMLEDGTPAPDDAAVANVVPLAQA